MSAKRPPIVAKRDLKEIALERAKVQLAYAKTQKQREKAMAEIDRLKTELGKH